MSRRRSSPAADAYIVWPIYVAGTYASELTAFGLDLDEGIEMARVCIQKHENIGDGPWGLSLGLKLAVVGLFQSGGLPL